MAAGVIVGLGIDLVEVDRIKRAALRSPKLIQRVFSAVEVEYAYRHSNPWPRFAARFAAKEAVLKALGVGLGAAHLADIQVCRAPGGAPSLLLAGRAAELAQERGVLSWHCSLTHSVHSAEAVVMAWGGPRLS